MKRYNTQIIALLCSLLLLGTSCTKQEPVRKLDEKKLEVEKEPKKEKSEPKEDEDDDNKKDDEGVKNDENPKEQPEVNEETDGFKLAEIKKPVEGGRVALAIKFSGQYCPPCGTVANRWDEAPHKYKNLIVATLHPFESYSPKFYNKSAGVYANSLGCNGIPSVFVNFNGDEISAWSPYQMQAYMEGKPSLSSIVHYKLNDTKVSLRVKSENLNGASYSSVKALVWVLENGIKAYQTKHRDYTHNHVFRSAPLGLGGKSYNVGSKQEFSFDLPNNVLDRNKLEVVYILFNSKKEIIYVTKFPLK